MALGVFKSQTPQTGPDWSGLMAATLVAALPMLVLFMVFAKRIVNSIGFSGIKWGAPACLSEALPRRPRPPRHRCWPAAAGGADAAAPRRPGHHRILAVGLGQQPGYQKCADEFAQQNPGLRVHISQYGWDDYWSKLTAGFIADTAPDVFTDHLAKFAQYVDLKVLRPLDDLAPTADIRDGDYQEGLAELWKGQDGKRYGAPKDWDTVAMFYNPEALQAAGVDPAKLKALTWNPHRRRHVRED